MSDDGDLLNVLQCPICLDLCKPPIVQCQNGHTFDEECLECHIGGTRTRKCPVCRVNMKQRIRCLALEKQTINVLYSCPLGCPMKIKLSEVSEHMRSCECRRDFKCADMFPENRTAMRNGRVALDDRFPPCQWKGNLRDYLLIHECDAKKAGWKDFYVLEGNRFSIAIPQSSTGSYYATSRTHILVRATTTKRTQNVQDVLYSQDSWACAECNHLNPPTASHCRHADPNGNRCNALKKKRNR